MKRFWLVVSTSINLLACPVGSSVAEATARPNFVVLFMDDLGYGDMGFTGHPTTSTPNLDQLAWNGKILTTWYSGCNMCTGSRAALMTGRQFPRTGLPGVLGPTTNAGLPLNETTIADQLKSVGYSTAIVGKWHLGQRQLYLPGNRGFDYYLGIPYSDDMGDGIATSCAAHNNKKEPQFLQEGYHQKSKKEPSSQFVQDFMKANVEGYQVWNDENLDDPAGEYLPLVYQEFNKTKILAQPLDFTYLAQNYSDFATNFIETHQKGPFFLYVPFSHVHSTRPSQPHYQYFGCAFENKTLRGRFGDALAEADWIAGNIVQKLNDLGLLNNTLILFTSDNGPYLPLGVSTGSEGLFTGRFAGYWNTGKGSTWEGGIRMPAFAYWKGKIQPYTRSAEVVSSMDVFPTLSALAGVPLPANRTYDGKDMSDILFGTGKSKHDFLFFYNTCSGAKYWSVAAVRHAQYKAHWCTAPGIPDTNKMKFVKRYDKYPILFNIDHDPSESEPLSTGELPQEPEHRAAMLRIMQAYAMEKATFSFGTLVPYPDGPGEGPGLYGLCCDRARNCNCRNGTKLGTESFGIMNVGTKGHHDRYHEALGEKEPWPPRTRAQMLLHNRDIA